MKKPRLGTNDWGTDDRGDEQGFFDSWVTCDERNAITEAAYHFRTAIGLSILSHRCLAGPLAGFVARAKLTVV